MAVSGQDLNRIESGWTPPLVALSAYIFLIFFAPQERYPALSSLRPALVAALLTAILCVIAKPVSQKAARRTVAWPSILLIGLAATLLVSNVFSPMAIELLPSAYVDFLKLVGVYLLTVSVLKTEKQLRLLVELILGFGGFIAVYSILGYRFGWVEAQYRMTSPFGGMGSNSNGYAMMLVGVLPFCLVYFRAESRGWKRLLLAVVALALVMCIIKTRSRMGFLGIIVQLGLFAFTTRLGLRFILPISVLVAIPILRANENLWDRVRTIGLADEDVSIFSEARSNKWGQALILMGKHPVTGVGISRFQDAIQAYGLGEYEHIVHNGYLEFGAEAGYASMLLFVGFVGITLNRNRFLMRQLRDAGHLGALQPIAIALFISTAALAFCLIFLSEQYNSMLYILSAISAALWRFADRQGVLIANAKSVEGTRRTTGSRWREAHRNAGRTNSSFGERDTLSRLRTKATQPR